MMRRPLRITPPAHAAIRRSRGAVLALLTLGIVAPVHAEPPPRVKFATLAPKGSIYHRVLQDLGAAISAGGGPRVTIYADGSQGGEADVVRRMRVGQLQGAMLSVVGLADIEDSVSVLQKLPLAFRSTAEVEYVGQALRPAIERRLYDKGFVALLWAEAGWVRFFSREAVAVPADLRTRRMFAWAGDPEQVELMKRLGYRPVVLETADIIPGLQTGLIDTVPLTPMWALATQVDALAPHMIDLKWAPIAGAVVIGREVFESLPQATQAAVRAAAAGAVAELARYQQDADDEAIAAMQRRGLLVTHLSPEQERLWQAFAAELYPLIRGRTIPAATFDAAQRLLAEYRAQAAPPAAVRR